MRKYLYQGSYSAVQTRRITVLNDITNNHGKFRLDRSSHARATSCMSNVLYTYSPPPVTRSRGADNIQQQHTPTGTLRKSRFGACSQCKKDCSADFRVRKDRISPLFVIYRSQGSFSGANVHLLYLLSRAVGPSEPSNLSFPT
jgi:hypothetical protein